MPAEVPNPYPTATPEEIAAAPGTREQKAARIVAARHCFGIPRRAILLGQADHSFMMLGILDLVTRCYEALDEVAEDSNGLPAHQRLLDTLTRAE